MRVLRIADIVNNRTGGMSRAMHGTSDALRAAGHHVDQLFRDDLRLDTAPRLRRFAVPARIPTLVAELQRAGQRYDVVELHEPLAAMYCIRRQFDESLPPLILFSHGLEARAHEQQLDSKRRSGHPVNWRDRWFPKSVTAQAMFALRRCDQILCASSDDETHLLGKGIPPTVISRLQLGVDQEVLERASEPARSDLRSNSVLFVGTWIQRKGIDKLSVAITRIMRRNVLVGLTVAGCGIDERVVRSRFGADIASRVTVIPHVATNSSLAELYSRHAILALPSNFEGQSLVMLEAAAFKLAIVATDTSGMRDFIRDGDNGLLFPVGDGARLQAALQRLLDDPAQASRLGENARHDVQPYTWTRSAAQLAAAYQRAIDRRRTITRVKSRTPISNSAPLRVLLTIHHDLDWNSGAAGSTLQLKRAYEDLGHSVGIYSFDNLPRSLNPIAKQIAFPAAVAMHLRRVAIDYDLVDASTGDAWIWASIFRHERNSPALVTRSTGLEHVAHLARVESARAGDETLSWRYPLYHGGARLREVTQSLRSADFCMFLNAGDRRYVGEKLGVEECRSMVVANGLPDYLLGQCLQIPPDEPIRIASIGTFIERKGIKFVVAAIERLLLHHPSLRISFLGTGVSPEIVRSRFSPGSRNRVDIVPWFEHRELPTMLAGHQILLFASLAEGFGKTLLEAMACGLAVVTSDASGPLELVTHESDALVVPRRDAAALASAVERLILDVPLRSRLMRAGYETAQQYSWKAVAQRRIAGYRRAIALHQGAEV